MFKTNYDLYSFIKDQIKNKKIRIYIYIYFLLPDMDECILSFIFYYIQNLC